MGSAGNVSTHFGGIEKLKKGDKISPGIYNTKFPSKGGAKVLGVEIFLIYLSE